MTVFIGIDPGPVPGIVQLTPRGRGVDVDVIQCTHQVAPVVLWALLDQHRPCGGREPAVVALERFVVSGRSARSRAAGAGEITRTLIGKLEQTAAGQPEVRVVLRPAVAVKAWATDVRLDRAGLFKACEGMRHARDAARHALFAAVHDGALPDPLSSNWRSK